MTRSICRAASVCTHGSSRPSCSLSSPIHAHRPSSLHASIYIRYNGFSIRLIEDGCLSVDSYGDMCASWVPFFHVLSPSAPSCAPPKKRPIRTPKEAHAAPTTGNAVAAPLASTRCYAAHASRSIGGLEVPRFTYQSEDSHRCI